jgi:hypothetical protein
MLSRTSWQEHVFNSWQLREGKKKRERKRERERQRKTEREREREREREKHNITLQVTPVTYFLQLSSTSYSFHNLSIVHSTMNSSIA